ncbi:MAG TPA: CrcB family protein [Dehalococcoidia bacterium]|jgi:CrcB protein|nr:CrcB family protein [Dehalococcoidia bacterium]
MKTKTSSSVALSLVRHVTLKYASMHMERVLVIAAAGALGAVSRYGAQSLANDLAGRPTLLGTLVVNLSGALLLGLLLGFSEERLNLPTLWRTAGAVGFLGAYTTFSTMMFESVERLERGEVLLVVAYLGVSIAFGLALAYTGLVTGRSLA